VKVHRRLKGIWGNKRRILGREIVKIERGEKEPRIIFPILGFVISFAVSMDNATVVGMLIMKIIEFFVLPQ
jgi:hypothetical protein